VPDIPAAWDSLQRESQARKSLKPAAFAAGRQRRRADGTCDDA
jgi:hypothetical protein